MQLSLANEHKAKRKLVNRCESQLRMFDEVSAGYAVEGRINDLRKTLLACGSLPLV